MNTSVYITNRIVLCVLRINAGLIISLRNELVFGTELYFVGRSYRFLLWVLKLNKSTKADIRDAHSHKI